MRKVKDALLGKCAECEKEIWRNDKGWVMEEYDGFRKRFLSIYDVTTLLISDS